MMRDRLYLFSSGTLRRQQNTLRFDGKYAKRPTFLPIEQIREILVFGELDFNKRVLEFLSQKGVIVHFFNRYGWYVGSFYPREHLNAGVVLVRQVEHYVDMSKRMDLARAFIEGAVWNMRQVLIYYERRGVDIGEVRRFLEGVEVGDVKTPQQLMAVEGRGREVYWRALGRIVGESGWEAGKRRRRPPSNEINSLISFGNSLMYTTVLSQIFQTHLDPRIGYLHESNFRRFTLNLDVAEVFKPVLVDRTVLRLINRKEIQQRHFRGVPGGIYLNEEGKKIFVKAWEESIRRTLRHPRLGRKVSYRTLIRLELYKIEKHLLEGVLYRPFRMRG